MMLCLSTLPLGQPMGLVVVFHGRSTSTAVIYGQWVLATNLETGENTSWLYFDGDVLVIAHLRLITGNNWWRWLTCDLMSSMKILHNRDEYGFHFLDSPKSETKISFLQRRLWTCLYKFVWRGSYSTSIERFLRCWRRTTSKRFLNKARRALQRYIVET